MKLLNILFHHQSFSPARLWLTIAALIGVLTSSGQQNLVGKHNYYFKRYEVEDGLSNNLVSCCAQDSKGFMWFGTFDGLNRFDGLNFKTFRNNTSDKKSLGDNKIFSLLAGTHNDLWIGTNTGLYKYEPEDESFKFIAQTRGRQVSSICLDNAGTLWFTANKKLCTYNEKTGLLKYYGADSFKATSICKDQNGAIWAASSLGTISKFNSQKNSLSFNLFPTIPDPTPSKHIVKIFSTENGSILIGTVNEGLQLFTSATGSTKEIPVYKNGKGKLSANEFIHFAGPEYWIGTETGLYMYNLQNGTYNYLHTEQDNDYSLSDNAITALFKDKEGGIWVGTRFGGVCYYPYPYTAFTKYFARQNENSIKGNGIHEIVADTEGNLWIGSEDAGLNKLSKHTNTFEHYFPDGKKGSICYSNIHGLLVDNGELWIGTYQHGLDRMNLKTKKVTHHYTAGETALTDNFIIHLFKTKSNQIYVGTYDGLYRYNRNKDGFELIPGFTIPTQSMMEDKNGLLWICTLGNGVFNMDSTGKIENLSHNPNNTNSLPNNTVNGEFIDSNGTLWFATEGGLCKYEPGKKIFKTYTAANGLPSNFLFKVLEDNEKNLWVSSTKGLLKINLINERIEIFTKAAGLLNDQFNWNSAYKDPEGIMYFGSVKGMISFNPKDFKTNTNIPSVYITNIQVNNKDIEISTATEGLRHSILYTNAIYLKHDQSSISIDFAALSFVSPEANKYAYKMEGLDNDWKFLDSHRKLYFTGLPPGKYVFRVKACNSSGIWNNKEVALNITIAPPLWTSTIAYIFYFIIGGLLIGLIINSYHKTFLEKTKRQVEQLEHEKEKQLYDYKIELFTNVAHEIRTPLTLIQGPMEEIMNHADSNPYIKKNLKIMERNTERLIKIANQVLDFRQAEAKQFSLTLEYTNISETLQYLHACFQPLADNHHLDYRLELPTKDVFAYIDPESFQKILSNLYSNAIKYANTIVLVKLKLSEQKDKLYIDILNDGHLIPLELKDKIFEPFFREKEIAKLKGSGIGLAIARSLTELHKGTLELKEPVNEMNIFQLQIPIQAE